MKTLQRRCRVEGISHKGEGVGRIDGKVVFVPGAIPGEEIECEVLHESRSLLRAALINIVEASEQRQDPLCPYYGRCEGCAYQHMSYSMELHCKRQAVEQQLRRIGGLQCEVLPVIGMDEPWSYRNKVEWQLYLNESGGASLGYINLEKGGPVAINTCLLLKPPINQVSRILHQQAGLLYMAGVRRIGIRWSDAEQALMLNLYCANPASVMTLWPQLAEVVESVRSVNLISPDSIGTLKGPGYITETASNLIVKISPLAFFQVNRLMADVVFRLIHSMASLAGGEQVIDAYCGTGIMALSLAGGAGKSINITGIESYPEAIQDARENALMNNLANCHFIEGACEIVLPALEKHCHLLILDPPRAGCKPQVLQAALQLQPAQIIYVSCNPATLARDLKILAAGGYAPVTVQPVDMFPRTWHVETVCLLER